MTLVLGADAGRDLSEDAAGVARRALPPHRRRRLRRRAAAVADHHGRGVSAAPDGFLGSRLATVLGGKSADALRKGLGLLTVEDLLRHYPRRYATRGELTDLSTLREGEQVTVMAEVTKVTVRPMRQRRGSILEAVISDGHVVDVADLLQPEVARAAADGGPPGPVRRAAEPVQRHLAAGAPGVRAAARRRRRRSARRAGLRRCPHPDLPGQQGGRVLAGAQGRRRGARPGRRSCRTRCPTTCARSAGSSP